MTNLEAYMAGLIPDDHPMVQDALSQKLLQPRIPMAPVHEAPRKKMWGATDVRGTASPQDVQAARGIQSWVADRPATLEAVPENFARGVVGMAAGLPQMVADPVGMAEAVVDQGTRLFGGIDPEEFNKLQKEIGPRRLDMYIKRNMAPDILSPKEEARVQTLLDKRSTVRAEELLKNPAESLALVSGGVKGLTKGPKEVLSAKTGVNEDMLAGGFKIVETPEKLRLFRMDWDSQGDPKTSDFQPSTWGWSNDPYLPAGRYFATDKTQIHKGISSPSETVFPRGPGTAVEDINRVLYESGMEDLPYTLTAGRPSKGSKVISIDNTDMRHFAAINKLTSKDKVTQYFKDQGVDYVIIENFEGEPGYNEIIQITPGKSKIRGRDTLYSKVPTPIGSQDATQDR